MDIIEDYRERIESGQALRAISLQLLDLYHKLRLEHEALKLSYLQALENHKNMIDELRNSLTSKHGDDSSEPDNGSGIFYHPDPSR